MSVIRAAILGAEREKERITATSAPLAAGSGDTALESIAAFIPSEVVGAYIAAFGIFAPKHDAIKWGIFGICVGLLIVLIVLGAKIAEKRGLPRSRARTYIYQFLLGFIAFSAWVCAMPETPFMTFTDMAPQIGGFLALVLAGLIPRVAEILDIKPRDRS